MKIFIVLLDYNYPVNGTRNCKIHIVELIKSVVVTLPISIIGVKYLLFLFRFSPKSLNWSTVRSVRPTSPTRQLDLSRLLVRVTETMLDSNRNVQFQTFSVSV